MLFILTTLPEYFLYTNFVENVGGFLDSSAGKESTCNAGDPDSIPGSGRSTGEGKCYPLQYPGLEISMDRIVHQFSSIQSLSRVWLFSTPWPAACIVHRVTKSRTRLSDFHFHRMKVLNLVRAGTLYLFIHNILYALYYLIQDKCSINMTFFFFFFFYKLVDWANEKFLSNSSVWWR